jgi:hypothetical protein
VILVAALVGLICGTLGVHEYEQAHSDHVSWISSLYHATQMFILHTPHFEHGSNTLLEIGRWSAATAFGLTAFIALYAFFRQKSCGHLRVGLERDCFGPWFPCPGTSRCRCG